MIVLEAGVLSMLLLELVKWLIGYFKKIPNYNFQPWVFTVFVPVLNVLMPFVMVYGLGMPSDAPVLTMSFVGVVQYVVGVAISSVATLFAYSSGLKPLKEYRADVKAAKLVETDPLTNK